MKKGLTISLKQLLPLSIILLYYLFVLLIYVIGLPIGSRTIATLIAAIASGIFFLQRCRRHIGLALFLGVIVLCGIASHLYNNNYSYTEIITSVSYYLIAYALIEYRTLSKKNRSKSQAVILYSYLYLGIILALQLKDGFSTDANTSIFYYVSHNYISVFGLIPIVLYYNNFNKQNIREYSLIPILIYSISAFFATGRGGIITAGLLLVIISSYRIIACCKDKRKSFIAIGALILLFLGMIVVLYSTIGEKYLVRFTSRGMESQRTIIIGEYFSALKNDWKSIFLGLDIRKISYLAQKNEFNLHNSFLQAHASFGLIFTSIIFIFSVKAIRWYIKEKDHSALILFVALLVRAFTDRVFYSMFLEPFLYFFVFYPVVNRRKNRVIPCL